MTTAVAGIAGTTTGNNGSREVNLDNREAKFSRLELPPDCRAACHNRGGHIRPIVKVYMSVEVSSDCGNKST